MLGCGGGSKQLNTLSKHFRTPEKKKKTQILVSCSLSSRLSLEKKKKGSLAASVFQLPCAFKSLSETDVQLLRTTDVIPRTVVIGVKTELF